MAATATIDDLTADAIRRALAAAAAGQLAAACAVGEKALAEGGDQAALHAMLGMLKGRSGEIEKGAEHLRLAHQARPADVVIATNLGSVLSQLGRYEEGLSIVTEELARSDKSLRLMKLRGFLAQMAEEFPLAIRSYEEVVRAAPDDWESWNNLGNARRLNEDFEGSAEALERAYSLNRSSPPIRLNYATALLSAGRFDEAEIQLRRMAQDFPTDTQPLRQLHLLLKSESRDDDALDAIKAAVDRAPDDLELRLALASHQLSMLQHAEAEATYRQVIAHDPSNELGNLGLAVVFELTNKLEALSALIGQAAARGVSQDVLNFIRAFDDRRGKRFEAGLAALQNVPDELESARRAHLLGQLEQGAGHYDEAFRAFERMNEIQLEDPSQPEERASAYRNVIRTRIDALTPEYARDWVEVEVDDRPSPVFLVGFPRSGTTLLDTILMSHPRIEVLEEEPALRDSNQVIADFAALPRAGQGLVRSARDAYFNSVAKLTPLKEGSLLVDKNPLAINALPFIRRIFPDARIILALRHPLDVVLSCFTTNFKLNDGMVSFLRLDTTAELYDLSFRLFERFQALLPMDVHSIRYEKIVEDRDRELRPLFDFLGLDWHDAVLDHELTARGRGYIKTASYAQVVEPIYTRSAGKWRNYREQLEEVIPVLRPWAEKFGYEI